VLNNVLVWARLGPLALLATALPVLTGWLLLGRWLGRQCARRGGE